MAIPSGLAGMLHGGPPVEPRPAASVLLIDRRRPWRVLMMRRPGGSEFAPGAHVYPGGSVHAEDSDFADPLRAAAGRELFEEMGILLARRVAGGRSARDPECERLRAALAGGLGFRRALAECGLEPAFDRLVFLARWITPLVIRRRFDTHFFVARRPPGQTVVPQPGEVVDWLWVSPAEALAEGGPEMVHATRRIMESVAAADDAGRLIAALRRRRGTLEPVLPEVIALPGGGYRVADSSRPAYRSRQRSRQSS